jgi:hypothetical protein
LFRCHIGSSERAIDGSSHVTVQRGCHLLEFFAGNDTCQIATFTVHVLHLLFRD